METMEYENNLAVSGDLITIEQLPVIRERLAALSAEIEAKTAVAMALACTEDTVKEVKTLRTELNKDFTALEERRKQVKREVLAPYEQFESVYKEFVSQKFRNADDTLKTKIDQVEDSIKQRKSDEVRAYFLEYRQSAGVDFIPFEAVGLNITLQATIKALKERAKAFLDRVAEDLALINTQEHRDEILVEYKKSLSASAAITAVTARHKALEEQRRQREEWEGKEQARREAVRRVEAVTAPLPPPAPVFAPLPLVEPEPVRTLAFKVTAPISMLKELKKFLDDGGYTYE